MRIEEKVRNHAATMTLKPILGSWHSLVILAVFTLCFFQDSRCEKTATAALPRDPADIAKDVSRAHGMPMEAHSLPDPLPRWRRGEYETIFVFHENTHRAHFRSGGLIIDFGSTGRHKHTLGDEKSGFLGDCKIDQRGYSSIQQGSARILFDTLPDELDELSKGSIVISGIGKGQNKAHVHLNDSWIGNIALDETTPSTVAIGFNEPLLKGQNELHLHCGNRDAKQEGDAPCLLLDYLKISPDPPESPLSETSRDREDAMHQWRQSGILELADGDSVTYNLPLPDRTHLLIEDVSPMLGDAPTLEVMVFADGEDQQMVISRQVSASTKNLAIPLDHLGGRAVSITLRVTGGSIALKHIELAVPRQETLAATEWPRATNFILVVIDTLRADRLRLYNRKTRVRTPIIDRLGRQAIVFERASAQASWTKPSVATLLTGLFPKTHNVQRHRSKLPQAMPLVSEHLQGLDFVTAGFVANGYISGEFGFARGWDHWINYGKQKKPNHAYRVFSDAAKWLAAHGREKPFFLYVHTVDPHAPYAPPRTYWQPYDTRPYRGEVRPRFTAELLKRIKGNEIMTSRRDLRRLEALYDGEVSYHDTQLAKLINAMETQGFDKNTLLIVTADHGEEFFDHGGVGHSHSLFEELIHVPLIVRLPKTMQRARQRSPVDVQLVDVLPTACDILGVPCPKHIEGQSLMPLIMGGQFHGYPRASFAELPDLKLHSVRMGDFKAIYKHLSPTHYDLAVDGKETTDLGPESHVIRAMLRDALGLHLSGDSALKGETGHYQKYLEEHGPISDEMTVQLRSLGYIVD